MALDANVIVAGIGCRKGATSTGILAAVAAVLTRDSVEAARLGAIATAELKGAEPGIAEAGHRLGLPVIVVSDALLQAAGAQTLTRSARVEALAGVPSVAECAALAAAGAASRLLGPRLVLGPVTCALADSGASP